MKLSHLFLSAALALPLGASAVPAYRGLIPAKLADGTEIQVLKHGDEFFSYTTDQDGYLLTGTPQGLQYELQGGRKVMADTEVLSLRAQAGEVLRAAANQQRSGVLDSKGRSTFPTLGDVHFIVALVEFNDMKFTHPDIQTVMDDMLNKQGNDYDGATGSMRDYFIEASNGKFSPHFDVTAPIQLNASYKDFYKGQTVAQGDELGDCKQMVKDVVENLDTVQGVDFSKYDYDGDGVLDTIIIFYAGYGAADTAGNNGYIWPHQSDVSRGLDPLDLTVDGKKVAGYCCFNELKGGYTDGRLAGIGTPCHEFCHVLGLPDIYYVANPSKPGLARHYSTPGDWEIMDDGAYSNGGHTPPLTSGYESWVLNWLEYADAQEGTHYSLASRADGGDIIKIPVVKKDGTNVSGEYFLLESRQKKGFDAYLPNSGMLIWHIDYNATVWKSNYVNTDVSHKRVDLVTADGSANYRLGKTNAPGYGAVWPGKLDYLTPDTEITLNAYSLLAASSTGDSFITSMAYDQATGRSDFDYNVYTETPEIVTTMHTPQLQCDSRGEATKRIQLSWDPQPEATGYQLSLWRVNTSGKVYYEQNLEDMNVGNVTYYNLGAALTDTKMGLEYHATVRCLKGIPAKDASNEVVFIPSELSVSGVEGVEADAAPELILGGRGSILAPASAQVYNLQGQSVGRTELAPGIYVVRTQAGTTAKVRVL